ncbi:MAG: pyruvate kinase [bacterium]
MKKTKVVCTIGPVSEQRDVLESLIGAGMNVMRMNFSHGDEVEQSFRINNIKAINKEKGLAVGILLDTKGPEIRTGLVENPLDLQVGAEIRVTMDYSYVAKDTTKVAISYPGLFNDIAVGGKILVEDGKLSLTVKSKDEKNSELVCNVDTAHVLKNKKNCNVPGVILNMEYISEKDKGDIIFGCKQDVDFLAASFVRRAEDLADLRALLASQGNTRIKIISKIENQEGVDNMDEIIELSDGVMVARGDLGVDVPVWELPAIQKEMIEKCQAAGKIVICATQMLDSMIENHRPTRAEATDCHNAVLDGTSATMLSGESAQGDFPLLAVEYMSKIDQEAEYYIDYEKMMDNAIDATDEDNTAAGIALAAAKTALNYEVCAIIAEGNEKFVYQVSAFRPCVDIFAAVPTHSDATSCSLAWGTTTLVGKADDALKAAAAALSLEKGDKVLKVTETSLEFVTIK